MFEVVFILLLIMISSLISTIAVYLAITERNLIRAVLFSALQSMCYAFIYFILMAPDIVLVYVPVSIGLYPAAILFLIRKTRECE